MGDRYIILHKCNYKKKSIQMKIKMYQHTKKIQFRVSRLSNNKNLMSIHTDSVQ